MLQKNLGQMTLIYYLYINMKNQNDSLALRSFLSLCNTEPKMKTCRLFGHKLFLLEAMM